MFILNLKNINRLLAITFFFLAIMGCKDNDPIDNAPTLQLTKESNLPDILDECSGLAVHNAVSFLGINDKGGASKIYHFNADGTTLSTTKITNGQNIDWEELARDEFGNLYVFDTGNNDNDRTDLKIYKINSDVEIQEEVIATEIQFSFEDQNEFPPSESSRYFDVESAVVDQGKIWLFTKDRSDPFRGDTRLYSLSSNEGTHNAVYIDSFVTADKKNNGAITAAALSPDRSKLVLISNTKLWLFEQFENNQFFSGTTTVFNLSTNTQIEGVAFGDNCTLYFSDEKSGDSGGNLYSANICQ